VSIGKTLPPSPLLSISQAISLSVGGKRHLLPLTTHIFNKSYKFSHSNLVLPRCSLSVLVQDQFALILVERNAFYKHCLSLYTTQYWFKHSPYYIYLRKHSCHDIKATAQLIMCMCWKGGRYSNNERRRQRMSDKTFSLNDTFHEGMARTCNICLVRDADKHNGA